MLQLRCLALVVILLPAAVRAQSREEWTPLFDGRSLAGWRNPYDWGETALVDGEIHLKASKKFFLCTERTYADFVFEAEILMPAGQANSGLMFRCHVEKNRVFGYQAEADTSERKWSGGLYDEGRRGWLHPKQGDQASIEAFRAQAGGAFKHSVWNQYRVQCEGDRIRVWVNQVLTTDTTDWVDARGHLALQHHGEAGQIYRFRNVRVRELVPAEFRWDVPALCRPPRIHEAPGFEAAGARALYFDGLPWKGAPTRVFAWLGLPKIDGKAPAMVLVHGGGGTAFDEWVRLWTSRGYAAIAMDLCGSVPRKGDGGWRRHDHAGPPGWGGFDQIDLASRDQWTYHAVADAILAHSLLVSLPEVDSSRIGITGISWGGYLTCIVASLDTRLRFAAPVYGCGFLGDNSAWLETFKGMGEEKSKRWLELWDPAEFLPRCRLPILWVNGTNDFAYPLDSYQKSYRLPNGDRTLAVRVRMAHAHGGPGEKPEEIHAFANALFRRGIPLVRITGQGVEKGEAWVQFESGSPIVEAELCFTKASGKWQERLWETAPGRIDRQRVSAAVPEGATVFYLNLIDDRGLVVSTEHVETKR